MWNKVVFLSILLIQTSVLFGQRTVGIIVNDSLSYNGYTLFSPVSSQDVYLIDNCGYEINSWQTGVNPGLMCYLLDDGSLLRTGRYPGPFNGGGAGGLLEIYNWEGDLTWSYVFTSEDDQQHHDVEPMPNGNILVIAWEGKTKEQAVTLGRDTNNVSTAGIWPDKIVEIKPIGDDSVEVVWDWFAWHHLIQDFDATKPNYGVVADHPELIDINFIPRSGTDWMHTNSVEYIEERDEILLSIRHLHEIWIIDHSTTRKESREHSGGNRGKGGDLLYRWGNPQSYKQGTEDDQVFFGQHSAKWMPPAGNKPGRIAVFNNGIGRGNYSSIDIIEPEIDAEDNYALLGDGSFSPAAVTWEYIADPPESMFNTNQGGVSVTPDDHLIVCNTNKGEFFELDEDKNILWKYICPVNFDIIEQGEPAIANGAFRVERYGPDFIGFEGKDLTPGDLIERNPLPDTCSLFPTIVSNNDLEPIHDVTIAPTLFTSFIRINNPLNRALNIKLSNIQGQEILRTFSTEYDIEIHIDEAPAGIYFIQMYDSQTGERLSKKVVKI